MTGSFKAALALSMSAHAGFLLGWPTVTSVQFDVERAPTSLQIVLVAPRVTPIPAPAIAETPVPLPASAVPEVPEPDRQTIVTPELKGALSDVLPGYLRNPAPIYPLLARQRGDEGTVLLRAEVLPTGRCGRLTVLSSSGSTLLDGAAVRAVRWWQFKPARRAGRPVAVWVEIPIRFRLIDSEGASP